MLFRHQHRCSSHIAGPAAWIQKCASTQHALKCWTWNAQGKNCLPFVFLWFICKIKLSGFTFIINKQIRHGLFFNNVNKPRMFLLRVRAYLMLPSMQVINTPKQTKQEENAEWPWIREWRLINENEINSPSGNDFRTCIVKESDHSLNNKPELRSKSQTSVSIVQRCTLTRPHLLNKQAPESSWTGVVVT